MSGRRHGNCDEVSPSGTKTNDDINVGLLLGVGLTDSTNLSSCTACSESAAGANPGRGGGPVHEHEKVLDSPSPIEAFSSKTPNFNASVGPGD